MRVNVDRRDESDYDSKCIVFLIKRGKPNCGLINQNGSSDPDDSEDGAARAEPIRDGVTWYAKNVAPEHRVLSKEARGDNLLQVKHFISHSRRIVAINDYVHCYTIMMTYSWLYPLGLDEILDAVVTWWHTFRTPIVLCALVVLIALRIYVHNDEEENQLVVLPRKFESDHLLEPPRPSSSRLGKKAVHSASSPRRIRGGHKKKIDPGVQRQDDLSRPIEILVFFSSVTSSTEKIARKYFADLEVNLERLGRQTSRSFSSPELHDLSEIDFEDFFTTPPKSDDQSRFFYLFLLPSYNIDTINDTLLQHMEETHHDFRVDTTPLTAILGYSVFGFGDREGWPNEKDGFCFQARELDRWMSKLTGRKRAFPVGMGDVKSDHLTRLEEWKAGVYEVLAQIARSGSLGEGVPGSGDPLESDQEEGAEDGAAEELSGKSQVVEGGAAGALDDVEDLGKMIRTPAGSSRQAARKPPLAVDFTSDGPKSSLQAPVVKEMVAKNSPTYAALAKQGYSIVGSHSGVKICRWTKSALRGRGSCYKYSLYGINSHQCMETTPSLSCSNKCVFCWRHGTNPVGTTWRWVVDPPDMIFDGVKENHYKKIRMIRGVPGVRAERYAEALRIRHCALSLVGEPIFYPHINEFLGLLHAERISSFLVCNAQHPDQLAALQAVTQLYVSIDASNRDSLRKIDRPLHRDFWERFQRCLDILREKRFRHRTVFRLTLVKGFNVEDEAEGYAQLVERGLPCFVEVKGMTYCGTSTSSSAGLSMSNVPFYWEVCDFVKALEARLRAKGLAYGIAAEHAHSCCILIASERFKFEGRWHTHIHYDKFFELLEERGPDGHWTPEDYMGDPTPEWALWGNGGFDPRDERVDRKGRKIENTVVREQPPGEVW